MSVIKTIIILMFISPSSFSEVHEIQSMEEIVPFIDDDTLVVFDIDNTLIEPYNFLGSDTWYYYLVDYLQKVHNLTNDSARRQAEDIWNRTQPLVKCKAVERATPELIASLEKQGNGVMALTARSYASKEITKKQLEPNKIYLTNPPVKEDVELDALMSTRYSEGILYVGEGQNKGKALVDFLKVTHLRPKKIVFVDDKKKHTNEVNDALNAFGDVVHHEFRYGNTDKRVENYLINIALLHGEAPIPGCRLDQ